MAEEENKTEMSVTKEPPMPFSKPLEAHGDLTVETLEKDKKEEGILPPIGTKFMVSGKEYKVVYLNPGKKRFSAIPCSGQY